MSEVEISGHKYRIPALPVMPDQFLLARKLSDVLSLLALQDDKTRLAEKFPTAFCTLMERASVEDTAAVMAACLGGVTREESGGAAWAKIWTAGRSMYADMDLSTIMQIVYHVLVENKLLDFFSGALSSLTENDQASSGSGTTTAG